MSQLRRVQLQERQEAMKRCLVCGELPGGRGSGNPFGCWGHPGDLVPGTQVAGKLNLEGAVWRWAWPVDGPCPFFEEDWRERYGSSKNHRWEENLVLKEGERCDRSQGKCVCFWLEVKTKDGEIHQIHSVEGLRAMVDLK